MHKQCKKCGEIYFLSEENFYKHPQSADGFRGICKKCYNEETKERYKHLDKEYKRDKITNKEELSKLHIISYKEYKREEINKEEIIKARKAKGLSRSKIAQELNMSYYTYTSIETRNIKTDKETLNKIREYLGI